MDSMTNIDKSKAVDPVNKLTTPKRKSDISGSGKENIYSPEIKTSGETFGEERGREVTLPRVVGGRGRKRERPPKGR